MNGPTLSIFALAFEFSLLLFQSTQIAPVAPASASIRRRQPHPHSHSMEELLLNPHYNQSKFYPDRYMMLNRNRDREGCPFVGSSRQIIGMVQIPMFFLVSFGFESLPLPVPYSSFDSRHPGFFFRMPGKVSHLSTWILRKKSSGLYKTEWKAGVEAQTKGERKSRKGGRSLVLVLSETSLSNSHFWVVSLFSYLERKKKLPFLFFLFSLFDELRFCQINLFIKILYRINN